MAGVDTSGSNPDVGLLYDINGLARSAPGWLDTTVRILGEYGLPLAMVVLVLVCWWTGRRRAESLDAAASSAAAAIWAPLAAALAVLVNVPIRGFVQRPLPAADHDGLDVLVRNAHGFSFVSDHATLTMALAAGLFVASRKFGLIGIVLALAEGFCRVYTGVHYPTDIVGGFALGTAVALLLSPLAGLALTPLTKAVGTSVRAGWLIRPRQYRVTAAADQLPGQDRGREAHERRPEQCSEPTRSREPETSESTGVQERRGRRVRHTRAARGRDRDDAGRRGVAALSDGGQSPAQEVRGETEPEDGAAVGAGAARGERAGEGEQAVAGEPVRTGDRGAGEEPAAVGEPDLCGPREPDLAA